MNADTARQALFAVLKDYDTAVLRIEQLTAAWADLTFNQRRAVGAVAPQLADALIGVENHRRDE